MVEFKSQITVTHCYVTQGLVINSVGCGLQSIKYVEDLKKNMGIQNYMIVGSNYIDLEK